MIRAAVAVCVCILAASPARAALQGVGTYSDSEIVGFAFFKLSHTKPDFSAWVKAMPDWQKASPALRPEIMRGNETRLLNGLSNYEPNEDLIHIMADATVEWNPNDAGTDTSAGGEGGVSSGENRSISVTFLRAGALFPFVAGDMTIEVIPKDLEDQTMFTLTQQQFDEFVQAAGRGAKAPCIVEMYLKPVRADADSPAVKNGKPLWPLLGEVAHFTIWDVNRQHILWGYDAPGFKAQDEQKILDLYNR